MNYKTGKLSYISIFLCQHLLEDVYDIRNIQELLGHKNLKTTMIYIHVLNQGGKGVRSLADKMSLCVRKVGT